VRDAPQQPGDAVSVAYRQPAIRRRNDINQPVDFRNPALLVSALRFLFLQNPPANSYPGKTGFRHDAQLRVSPVKTGERFIS